MTDTRPAACRERLREEGKAYPKSGCTACGANLATGLKCKHDAPKVAVDIEARDKEGAPKIVIDLAGAMDKLTPQMIEAMAPILRDPMVMALEAQIMALQEALDRVRVAIGMEPGIAGAPGDIAAEAEKRALLKGLVTVPVFVLIADDHDYDAMSQWLAGVFLSKEEAEEAQVIEDAKPKTRGSDIHEWEMVVDAQRLWSTITTPSKKGGAL
ncbi:hypothetical protein RCXUPER_198 [Rhodobacter phage RcXuper]|nr:hypothetical protein RCXUPER_198 [Rhodobacter phage RcXuper]